MVKRKRFQARRVVFTLSLVKNPEWTFSPDQWDSADVRYVCGGWEVGKDGYEHFQGYAEFLKQKCSKKAVQRALKIGKSYVDIAKGTPDQNQKYTGKDGKFHEWGKPALETQQEGQQMGKKSRRTDLDVIKNAIKDGSMTMFDIMENHFSLWVQYRRSFQKCVDNYAEANIPEFREVPVTVLWGEAGVGKTRTPVEKYPNDWFLVKIQNDKLWFDGYKGQSCLIVDDFYGQIRVHLVQKLLDGYRSNWEVKGGFVWGAWKEIFLTSNTKPSEWYTCWERIPRAVEESIIRRINTVTEIRWPVGHSKPKLTWASKETAPIIVADPGIEKVVIKPAFVPSQSSNSGPYVVKIGTKCVITT